MTVAKGMRYESADVADVERYVADPAWAMEQKLDGIRCLVRTDDTGRASFYSHSGEPLRSGIRHFPAIARQLDHLISCTLDGELLATGELWLFDVLEVLGTDTRLLPQSDRRDLLEVIGDSLSASVVRVVAQATTPADKAALWASVVAASTEGVVVKRRSASYSSTRRSADVLKIKRVYTVDAVVLARNSDGHNNAILGMYDGDTLVPVGKCSMNGKSPAQAGDVIEVTFLGRYDGNLALTQPRMMRARPDKAAAECTIDQLGECHISRAVISAVTTAPPTSSLAMPCPTVHALTCLTRPRTTDHIKENPT